MGPAPTTPMPMEDRPRLAANGFRAGIVSGLPPTCLQDWLTSPKFCTNARRLSARPGDPTCVVYSNDPNYAGFPAGGIGCADADICQGPAECATCVRIDIPPIPSTL